MEWENLPKVLKSGYFIKTQPSNIGLWSINSIIHTDKESITIPFVEEYYYSNLLLNDIIKCKFSLADHDFTLICRISEFLFKSPPAVKLKVLKIDVWKNIRDSIRYDVNCLCKITDSSQYEFPAFINNLSSTGLAVVCREQLPTDSKINLSIYFFDRFYISLYAIVVRNKKTIDNKIEYGLRFVNITEEEKSKIETIINQIKLKEEDIFDKWCKYYGITPANMSELTLSDDLIYEELLNDKDINDND